MAVIGAFDTWRVTTRIPLGKTESEYTMVAVVPEEAAPEFLAAKSSVKGHVENKLTSKT